MRGILSFINSIVSLYIYIYILVTGVFGEQMENKVFLGYSFENEKCLDGTIASFASLGMNGTYRLTVDPNHCFFGSGIGPNTGTGWGIEQELWSRLLRGESSQSVAHALFKSSALLHNSTTKDANDTSSLRWSAVSEWINSTSLVDSVHSENVTVDMFLYSSLWKEQLPSPPPSLEEILIVLQLPHAESVTQDGFTSCDFAVAVELHLVHGTLSLSLSLFFHSTLTST